MDKWRRAFPGEPFPRDVQLRPEDGMPTSMRRDLDGDGNQWGSDRAGHERQPPPSSHRGVEILRANPAALQAELGRRLFGSDRGGGSSAGKQPE